MSCFVECWHCDHYIWFSTDSNNLLALCDIKKCRVFAGKKVCEQFVLGKGIHTKRDIPDYCIHYQKNKIPVSTINHPFN